MRHEIIRASERGSADHGWLKANHYFSFGSYYDPSKMAFGKLRVINDDQIAPGQGFPAHPHNDMEIITIPLSGAVRHEDSQGNHGIIGAGEVQIMSAGSGIRHSEYNASDSEFLKLFQIWVESNKVGVEPRYDQKRFEILKEKWNLLVSPISEDKEGLKVYQDVYISMTNLEPGSKISYKLHNNNHGVYMIAVDDSIKVLGEHTLEKRDAIAFKGVDQFEVESLKSSRVLLIEVSV